ncbi:MAG: 2-oxoacid:acceptor oxidoreductase subunit alpha [Synergistaceae bacterium]|jgi:2-oxoglutarate ferredoxin oxidoreductase subunit alpha|nr:2-oxoacid:acceptor oxidoreductase subunit alpha [Synergistaceae bacterium]
MEDRFAIMTGNEACVRGAVVAGMNFFAGYPITPATEIAEIASALLPKKDGKFMQMEDEIASIAAVIGASFAGAKAMTATSGPGISLMQENLGFAIIAEVPIVIVDVMRQGPCQGVATAPAQGDFMQTKWGTHGDHPVIALAPASVGEVYVETIRAFNLAEKYRTPVHILSDAMLAHMSERVRIPEAKEYEIVNRKTPTCAKNDYKPYQDDGTGVPPMAKFGDGYKWYVSGIIHDETGFPVTNEPEQIGLQIRRLLSKVENNRGDIEKYEEYRTEDAEILLSAVGMVSRSAKAAIDQARNEGIRVGLLRPITLWPFPERRLAELAGQVRTIVTCEMNEGQLFHMVRESAGGTNVRRVTQNNGKIISAQKILTTIRELQTND